MALWTQFTQAWTGSPEPPKAVPESYYRPELDWLRFVAFSSVFLCHFFPKNPASYANLGCPVPLAEAFIACAHLGGYGVDLFFVLSAFLLTKLLLAEKDRTGQIHVRAFYVRRLLRIWPLYFAYLAVMIPVDRMRHDTPASYYAMYTLFVGNWFNVLWYTPKGFLSHLWSVCIEEQFYLFWPLMMSMPGKKRLLQAMGLMLAVSIGLRFFLSLRGANMHLFWFNSLTRLDPFAAGGLLALCVHYRSPDLSWRGRCVFLLAGGGLFAAAGFLLNPGRGPDSPASYPVVAAACACWVFAMAGGAPLPSGARLFRALSYLGKISYGLYVFHFPVGAFVFKSPLFRVATPYGWMLQLLLAALLTLAISALSYALLEKPFLLLKERFAFVRSRPA